MSLILTFLYLIYCFRIFGDPTFMSMVSLGEVGKNINSEFDDLQLKSLEDVLCPESGSYWVFGRVIYVECHYGQWFYESRKICVKKLEQVALGKYYYVRCKKIFGYAKRRYKFVLNIFDDTSNVSLLLWDREAIQLLDLKVEDIVNADEIHLTDFIPRRIEDMLC
ncbi:uncharacterized protein LOC121750263 isoform X2 [Salvia splendens]|uniref:uncharacterized protein LOC121750263 isoform X2 n=1 Tax=Salvia splendens TaxID=180675 RepID=UPI001C2607A6|nr:uncharacterized protein LOC121750263 isoform X2 [Salvia splendens]